MLDYLLPQGVKQHGEYCVGSVCGEAGDSLRVRLQGHKKGIWCDFSNEHHKGDIVDLWCQVKGIRLPEACKQIREYLGLPNPFKARKSYKRPEFPPYEPEPNAVSEYLIHQRLIRPETLNLFGVSWDDRHYILPSYKGEELIHWKKISIHRPQGKKIVSSSAQTEPILFGWQAIENLDIRHILICEGELDAMSFAEYGIPCLSVPFGGGGGRKQSWLDSEMESLSYFDTIYLVMDVDGEGFESAREIVSRLGQHRCKVVELPLKDCNDCLREGVSKEAIVESIQQARSLPPEWLTSKQQIQTNIPHNTLLEQYVLSWLLNNHDDPHLIFSHIGPEDFYWPSHRVIFEVALELNNDGQSLGIANIISKLTQRQVFGELIAQGHLDDLRLIVPDDNIVAVCEAIRGLTTRRQLVGAGEMIQRIALTDTNSLEAVSKAQEQIIRVVNREIRQNNLVTTAVAVEEAMTQIKDAMAHPGELRGVPSGFKKLDWYTSGFDKCQMVTVAARPSMGKTAFALNMAHHVSVELGQPVIIFSMEMSRTQLMRRLLAIEAEVDCKKLKTGQLNGEELAKIQAAYAKLQVAPIFIDDSVGMTPTRIRLACENAMMRGFGKMSLIMIDYMGLMNPDTERKQDNTNDRVTAISHGIKAIAKSLETPVINLSQLSRAVDLRQDKRPMLSDLRDSGSIEQDSDMVMFLYRDEYYHRENSKKKGIAEVILAKQRDGDTGTIDLVWDHKCTKFRNIVMHYRDELPPL